MPLLIYSSQKSSEKFDVFVSTSAIEKKIEEKTTIFSVPVKKITKFEELKRAQSNIDSALYQTPRALIVALVSCLDAYLGDLLKSLFYLKPEILNSSERQLTFKQLVKFKDIDAAREYITEKEVESIIRESHAKQIKLIEQKFDLPLTKDLDIWTSFIELTERRNLFVHTDGIVSNQYLEVCRLHGVEVTNVSAGDRLSVSRSYFNDAYNCIYEFGVKLGIVLWRKIAPDELEDADTTFLDITFNLLKSGEYALSKKLFQFATQLKKHGSNRLRRVFVINLAIACKWGGDAAEANKILDSEDWSDSASEFLLAVSVLKDKFVEAEAIMRQFPDSVNRSSYESWPLFKEFRKTDNFLNAYKEIFGEDFEVEEKRTPEQEARKKELSEEKQSQLETRSDEISPPDVPPQDIAQK